MIPTTEIEITGFYDFDEVAWNEGIPGLFSVYQKTDMFSNGTLMEGNSDMGDVYLTYDDGGAYQRRWVYLTLLCTVILLLVPGLSFVTTNNLEIIVIIIPAALVAGTSLIYALYFIQKNPP